MSVGRNFQQREGTSRHILLTLCVPRNPFDTINAGCWLCPAGLVFSACCLFLPARNVEPGPGAATSLSPATDRGNMRSCQLRGDLSSGILIHSFICITTLLFSPGHGGHGTTCSNVTSLYFIPLIAAALLSMSTGSQRSRDHDFCFTVTYDD